MVKVLKSILRVMVSLVSSFIGGVVLLGLLGFYVYKVEPNWIQVRTEPIYVQDLAHNFRSFRIVQISDLHGKNFSGDQLVEKVNSLNPDVIAITGDIYDEAKNVDVAYASKVLGGLRAKYGVFYVLGNNDYYLGTAKIDKELKSIGIELLQNSKRKITVQGESIWLIGVEDPELHKDNLATALQGADSKTRILLAHSPEIFADAVDKKINLLLTGHTHGGQVHIPSLPEGIQLTDNLEKSYKNSEEKYIAGIYQDGKTQMYVNRGLGETELPLRFMVRPEITLLTLHRQEQSSE